MNLNAPSLVLQLTPSGALRLSTQEGAEALEGELAARLTKAFDRGAGSGLLQLGGGEIGRPLPPAFAYWRDFATHFLSVLCARPEDADDFDQAPPPPPEDLADRAEAAPLMPGAEYLTSEVLQHLWEELGRAFQSALAKSRLSRAEFLKTLHPTWNVVGRVHFNLAENRKDEERPFAFLATYTDRLSTQGRARHLPLAQALEEYRGARQKDKLLSLLLPMQRAAEECEWLREMVADGEIFHPIRWTPAEAFRFLGEIETFERAGVVVRMPAHWPAGRPTRPKVTGIVGAKRPSTFGLDAMLDFRMELTLDGEKLTPKEIETILAGTTGLALIRGQWVEVDRQRLMRAMDRYQKIERLAARGGLSFAEASRLLSGAALSEEPDDPASQGWSGAIAGPWLKEQLAGLRSPEGLAMVDPGERLKGRLRPYQQVGVRWLNLLSHLGLGACLADDMGLGKTIQVLSLLLVRRQQSRGKLPPSLLVVPASLLANWAAEIERFAPDLSFLVAHRSAISPQSLNSISASKLDRLDLIITSYGSLLRLPWLESRSWDLAILDEAQAIKNPNTRQTKAVKKLQTRARIALTGTPVENRLGDLWSIFDFINPGLLGSAKEFTSYTRRLADRPHNPFGPLRDLIRPYLLRRLKTDRSVITDLPDKTEVRAFCLLSRRQAVLYQEAVDELSRQIRHAEGVQRRGLVLAFLTRFKQICNHPSQWLGDGLWAEEESGKWARLRELAEVIASRQEKVLIFTQFREVTGPLSDFLGTVFGRGGLVLHGGTPVAQRRHLVRQFQEDESVPFFILSLKAGGSGLNLTAATHVIHFDRWWNPAVENQATDRAFRIGQKRNVMVHKFVCQGTVEEKIDQLISEKTSLSKELLEGGAELNLTEWSDEELIRLVSLDLKNTSKE